MRYIKTLLKLKKERTLNYSSIPKKLLQDLLEEELIQIESSSSSRRKVSVNSAFDIYYKDLEKIQTAQTRAELILAKTDTKNKKISPQDGLYLCGNIFINNIDLNLFEDSALFIKSIPKIENDVLVVGVENFENLIYAKKQFYLFEEVNILFVFRNKKMLEFLETLENRIIYFGDFDLAGIFIYLNEILKRAKYAKFFLPQNLEYYIDEYGSKELFQKQINKYKNLITKDRKLQNLIEFINKKHKVLEQEFFIKERDND